MVKAYKGEMPEMCITLHEMTERGNKNAGVACFEHDRMLDDFLRKPNWFIERLRRYMCMVMPDFSLKVGMPMAVQICNAYINHVMAFYAAEQRINVMPSMSWSDRRSYSTIGTLGRIKIVQCDKYKTNPTATYSNTKNTTYYSYSKEQRQIERICYYRNHRLYKTVDFKKGEKPHTHYWHTKVVGRKRHDKKNIHELTKRDERLMNKALEYNKKGGK